MIPPLSATAKQWVEKTLSGMSDDQCLGHLLCPEDRKYTPEQWAALLRDVPVGSVFLSRHNSADWLAKTAAIQGASEIPVLVASDLEHGAGCMIADGGVDFPWAMACGAANSVELAYQMGLSTGQDGRAHGIHWTFGPVADLNRNVNNPVTNIRSLGDDPKRAVPILSAWIRGIQEHGRVAATAKHWPGDGIDDRDQHLCTSVNGLSMYEWRSYFGPMWRAAFDAGVMSVMAGHISLPAYEQCRHVAEAMPATLSRRLQMDLLRGEFGFDGVLVSDAAPMIGLTSRCPAEDLALRNVLAGSDVFLFSDARQDFARLKRALREGELTEERLRTSVRRVLEMKARLGLHERLSIPMASPQERANAEKAAQQMADQSVTLLRRNAATPLKLKPGARVLTVTIRYPGFHLHMTSSLPLVDEELRKRGMSVEHVDNPSHSWLIEKAPEFDAVFVNFAVVPHSHMGTVRLTGDLIMPFWRGFWLRCPNAVFTSFGNPYTLYELPHLPNFYATYGFPAVSQIAAVRAWLGETQPIATAPFTMPAVVEV